MPGAATVPFVQNSFPPFIMFSSLWSFCLNFSSTFIFLLWIVFSFLWRGARSYANEMIPQLQIIEQQTALILHWLILTACCNIIMMHFSRTFPSCVHLFKFFFANLFQNIFKNFNILFLSLPIDEYKFEKKNVFYSGDLVLHTVCD